MNITSLRNLTRQHGNVGYALVGVYLLARWLWQERRALAAFGLGLCVLFIAWTGWHNQMEPSAKAQYTVTDLGTLPNATECEARGLNMDAQVVGVCVFANGVRHAFMWQNDKMTDLHSGRERSSEATAINSKGEVVGWFNWMRDYKAFSYDGRSQQAEQLPSLQGDWSGANAINDAGQIAGQADLGPKGIPGYGYLSHACLWQQGKTNDLGTLGGGKSGARSVNKKGQVVGWSYINDAPKRELHAFLWQKGKMRDLNTLIPKNAGWVLEQANGINDKGHVVGTGLHNGQRRAFLLMPSEH